MNIQNKIFTGLLLTTVGLGTVASLSPVTQVEVQAATCVDSTYTVSSGAGVVTIDLVAEGVIADESAGNGTFEVVQDNLAPGVYAASIDAAGVVSITTAGVADAGAETITYTASDNAGAQQCVVTLNLDPNEPPVANDDAYATTEDVAITGATSVLANDTDDENAALTAVLVTTTANGVLTLNPDGTFDYTPNANFVGVDTFTYSANDGFSNSAPATVSITVVEDTAVADDVYSTEEETLLSVAAPGVLANDTDLSGDALVAVLDTTTTNGTLVLNADGSFEYTPNANFSGIDTFTYTVDDGSGAQTATVTINVSAVDDAPIAIDDAYTTLEDVTLTIDAPGVLTNDFDLDSTDLTAVLDTAPANGTVTLNADGSFEYTPNMDFNGTDTFTYVANDGTSDSNVATVTITVDPVFDYPRLVLDQYTFDIDEGDMVTFTGMVYDVDDYFAPGEAVLTVYPATVISEGGMDVELMDNGDGTYSFETSYLYQDDNPNDTAADSELVTFQLRSISAPVAVLDEEVAEVNVYNVAPAATMGNPSSDELTVGEEFTLEAEFTDPGVLDDKMVVVNFGDGSDEVVLNYEADALSVDYSTGLLSHTYTEAGEYTVTITFSDDDTGVTVWNYDLTVLEADTEEEEVVDPETSLSETGTQANSAIFLSLGLTSLVGLLISTFKKSKTE